MAHRKPLGTTCICTFDWAGDKPDLGDYLVSAAGTAYLVVGVEEKTSPAKVGLVLERIASAGDDAPVHGFEWYPRDRSRSAA